jgi:hypothetical protein
VPKRSRSTRRSAPSRVAWLLLLSKQALQSPIRGSVFTPVPPRGTHPSTYPYCLEQSARFFGEQDLLTYKAIPEKHCPVHFNRELLGRPRL